MEFRHWLENENNIHFLWSSYGEITAVIGERRYVYDVDAFYFPKLKVMLRKAGPWVLLNYIKKKFPLIAPEELPLFKGIK